MSYREIFSIISIIMFSTGTLAWLLYFFCINPVYNMLCNIKSSAGYITFMVFMGYYCLSILGVVLVVIFDVGPNSDGMEIHELITMFGCMIPTALLFVATGSGLIKLYNYLKSIHNSIHNKRMS
ncbi:TPA: hypothetical protein NV758_001600 [Escherichia coli]|uniref:hypothetical protein n=1 Tax=Escherichia coli TaxID=562 RepID=UPI000A2DB4A9|nr:hypothetical protein B1K96_15280 [Escherichia coli]HCJ8661093.1 hypothetical protein [Escherichia coli]HCJ8666585.1 hypothetical protein [Escherichia coli]